MSKKQYEGLELSFVPYDGAKIVTTSTSGYCTPVSVQYYIASIYDTTCDAETDQGLGYGYSYNLEKEPDPNW